MGFVSFPDRDLDRLEIGGTLSWGPPFDVTYNQAGAMRAAYLWSASGCVLYFWAFWLTQIGVGSACPECG